MLNKEDWMKIKAQIEKGVYQKDIADELGVHPRTIRRALARQGPPSGRRPNARKSKLDAFKPFIDELLRDGVWNAKVILMECRQRGYTGGYTIIRDYIYPKRPLRQTRATVRFETEPGHQMQNDWGAKTTLIGGRLQKVHFTVNTLGYSRRFHFWCSGCEDAEHTYEGIIRSLEYFGGVPKEVLVDNQKSLVIEHRIRDGVRFNERFIDLAGHYGFTPRACRPYRPQTKGKDERMVGYIKGNFFVRYRSFESIEHMNALAEQWLREEADKRMHGALKEVVAERFDRESPALMALPAARFDTSYRERRLVHWDGYINVRGNRYSVPADLCGKDVLVRISLDGRLSVYADDIRVAEHVLRSATDGWVSVKDHHQDLWQGTFSVQKRDLSVYEEVGLCS
ncbi:MAG: IS21 family transposase [Desulfomonilia bacterium]